MMHPPGPRSLTPVDSYLIATIRGWQGEHYAEVSAEYDPVRGELIHLYVDDPTRPTEPAAVVVDLSVDAARHLANQLITAIAEHLEREEETHE